MTQNIFQKLYHKDLEKAYANFDGIILDNKIDDLEDVQSYFENLRSKSKSNTKILVSYHNHFWEPILTLASKLGLRKKVGVQNWLDQRDVENLLNLSEFEVVSTTKRFFGLTVITIAKTRKQIKESKHKEYSVSVVVPARNEEGNIAKVTPNIPKFGKWQEFIFVEGNSTDKTWSAINNFQFSIFKQGSSSKNPNFKRTIKAFRQKGKGKADAVKLGFEKASGDILMIYDADRTVNGNDLEKFYRVLSSGIGRFANGSRMVYPMEKDAMRTLNKIGNKIFGLLFSSILGTRFKDTLCGTKAMWRRDFVKFKKDYKSYLKTDPFGDFALIFTAIKHKMKVVEIPVRYKERVYGSTNINRFRHGLLLCKMTLLAFIEFKL